MTAMSYPPTRTTAEVADVAGLQIADPYRWLEDDGAEVHRWQRAQARLAQRVIFAGQDPDRLRALVESHQRGERPSLPRSAGGRWFQGVQQSDGRSVVLVSVEPFGPGEVLVDFTQFAAADDPAVLSWLCPSPDGRVLAIGVCTDGSEHNTIRLLDTHTGALLHGAPTQVLHSAWAGGVSWLPDSSGFYFCALTGTPKEFRQATFQHHLEPARTQVEPIPIPDGSLEYTFVEAEGDWAVANHRLGNPIPVAVRSLGVDGGWRRFVTDCDGTVAGHVLGDSYVAVTDVGAPRGRVVAIPLHAADPNDQTCWTELVPEGDTVLRGLTVVGDSLYLSEFDRTFARVRVIDPTGAVRGVVPLPGRGAIATPFFALTALAMTRRSEEFLCAFSTLTESWGVYRHRPGETTLDTLLPPAISLDADVRIGSASARDGTPIPFHAITPRARPAGPMPTLVSAYGAANVPLLPSFQPDLASVVESGAVVVQAYLRGGGEFGRDWWLAAHRERKRVRDDDLVAVAEHLLTTGATTTDMLALTGGSDAGLMCGVAVTQRPDLWRAVLPRAPLLDLVGGIRDPYLNFVIRKAWADPDDPAEVQRLLTLSPYELVRPARFPAVYIQAGSTDPRCPPWQARKFTARLQAAQQGEAPILVHVFDNAGHGAATARDVALAQDTEWLAFLIRELGLTIASGAGPQSADLTASSRS